MFELLKGHSFYKNQGDLVRSWILAATLEGRLVFDQFKTRLEANAPDVIKYLRQNRLIYQKTKEETEELRQRGYQFVCFGEDLYPPIFYLMEDPPLSFTFFGFPAWQSHPSLAIVGSRDPREESLLWMDTELNQFLEVERLHIVSGGARGIDQKAHAIALRQGLPTTIVVPSGLGQLYPASLEGWKKSVLENGGCFLSEYAFNQPMKKFLFHHRNRLIAALGEMVLIVEARKRSGTLITALQAAKIGRQVLIIPGHPQDKNFGGSLDLLAEGATPIRDAQDLGMFYRSELWVNVTLKSGVEPSDQGAH